MVQDIWFAVRVEAAATLALMSFWGWYCYYLTKLVVDCFCQRMDGKLVSIMVDGFTKCDYFQFCQELLKIEVPGNAIGLAFCCNGNCNTSKLGSRDGNSSTNS